MTQHETFEDWQARTAPTPESMALATSARLPFYLVCTVVIVFWSRFTGFEKVALLAALALWYPTGVLVRRLLREGATLDDPRLQRIRWLRLTIVAAAAAALAWGSARDLVLVAVLTAVSAADLHWRFLERAAARLHRRSGK